MSRLDKNALAERVRAHLIDQGYGHNQKLPPERQLCELMDVSRSQLRAALAMMEEEGLIWRHVGRGTFVGAKPVLNLEDVTFLGELTSPAQVLESRAAIEPALAELAATHATAANIEEIINCAGRCRAAKTWRGYEAWDNKLHDAIAHATRNKVLIYLFETLNVLRRSIVWDQHRQTDGPMSDHKSFLEHDLIIAAIRNRQPNEAAKAMRNHLLSVKQRVTRALVFKNAPAGKQANATTP